MKHLNAQLRSSSISRELFVDEQFNKQFAKSFSMFFFLELYSDIRQKNRRKHFWNQANKKLLKVLLFSHFGNVEAMSDAKWMRTQT